MLEAELQAQCAPECFVVPLHSVCVFVGTVHSRNFSEFAGGKFDRMFSFVCSYFVIYRTLSTDLKVASRVFTFQFKYELKVVLYGRELRKSILRSFRSS